MSKLKKCLGFEVYDGRGFKRLHKEDARADEEKEDKEEEEEEKEAEEEKEEEDEREEEKAPAFLVTHVNNILNAIFPNVEVNINN